MKSGLVHRFTGKPVKLMDEVRGLDGETYIVVRFDGEYVYVADGTRFRPAYLRLRRKSK